MALLEVDSLRVGYGFPVLMGISFEVEEGETAVMFGLNGAGKTTTVSTIAGLLKPDGGSIRFDGKEIGGRPAASLVSGGVALVPEGRRVFAGLSVANNLRLFLIGQYPADQAWRIWGNLAILSLLGGLSAGVYGRATRALAVTLSGSIAISHPAHAIYNDYSYCGIAKCKAPTP